MRKKGMREYLAGVGEKKKTRRVRGNRKKGARGGGEW